jgi:hypothetical protein
MRHDPTVESYTVNVANTASNAFGGTVGTGPTALFSFRAKSDYISPQLMRNNTYQCPEVKRGLDYAIFTFDEFYDPAAPLTVPDNRVAFLTVTQNFHTGGQRQSPILIIPPATFAVTSAPALTVSGTAPGITYNVGDPIPETQGVMNLHMPLHTKTVNIVNNSSNSTDVLYIAFSPGMPMVAVGAGNNLNLTGAAVPEVFLAGNVDIPFSATFLVATTVGL